MKTLATGSTPLDDDETEDTAEARMTTPSGNRETKWTVVAETPGLAAAEIIANRLVAEGIPARAWQEGAGQAFGLTVGLLGTGHVVVPDDFAEEAKAILATTVDDDFFEDDTLD